MLDRDEVACHNDALDEELDETLAPREVQVLEPRAQRRGKGLQVIGQPFDASFMLVLGSKPSALTKTDPPALTKTDPPPIRRSSKVVVVTAAQRA
jgi:hypothetical protein